MKFELWSIWHILYMVSPFIIYAIIHFCVSNKTERTKNIVGIILGVISILILVVRNVDIYLRDGWDLEVIPLQVCHIGSLIVGLALIFKRKWLFTTAFCFNLIPAFLAMVFADSLTNYDTLLKIRPQTYIWGHIFIVVCAFYSMFIFLPKLTKKDLFNSVLFVSFMSVIAIICNSLFRVTLYWEPNYFYLYNYEGTPLKFLYQVMPTSRYGWFTINWFYVITLLVFFMFIFYVMYSLANSIIKKIEKK